MTTTLKETLGKDEHWGSARHRIIPDNPDGWETGLDGGTNKICTEDADNLCLQCHQCHLYSSCQSVSPKQADTHRHTDRQDVGVKNLQC